MKYIYIPILEASSFDDKNKEPKLKDYGNDLISWANAAWEFFNKKYFNGKLIKGEIKLLRKVNPLHMKKGGHYEQKTNIIALSPYLSKNNKAARTTLLHEMCHQATFLINKSREHHGPNWTTWMKKCKLDPTTHLETSIFDKATLRKVRREEEKRSFSNLIG